MLKLEKAVDALTRLVKTGQEFPDAAWYVCKEYNVKIDDLRSGYDEACAAVRLRHGVDEPAAATEPPPSPQTTFARGYPAPW